MGAVKIDKSFVMDMAKDADNAMIVRSTIYLAHNLGVQVIAEGVEAHEVWRERVFVSGVGPNSFGQPGCNSRPLSESNPVSW